MIVAYVLLLVAFFDNFAMLPTLAPYADGLGARLTGVGIAVGAYSLTNLVFNIVGGVLLDRLGRRRLVVGSLLMVSATMLCYPLVSTLEGLVVIRLVHGIGGGILVPAVFTVLGDRAPREGRGRAMGRAGAAIGAAAVLAPALAGGIRQAAGFPAVFWAIAGITAAGAVLAALRLEETRPAAGWAAADTSAGALLRRPPLRLACATAFVFTGAVGSLAAFLPVHVEGLGGAASTSGALFSLFAIVAAAVMLSRVAGLAEHRGLTPPIALGLGAYVVALGVLASAPGLAVTAAAAGLFGLGYGLVFPAMAGAVSAEAAPHERGRAYGMFLAAFSLGFVVVPPLGGALADRWPGVSPFTAGMLVCLGGIVVALAHRAEHRSSELGGGRAVNPPSTVPQPGQGRRRGPAVR